MITGKTICFSFDEKYDVLNYGYILDKKSPLLEKLVKGPEINILRY